MRPVLFVCTYVYLLWSQRPKKVLDAARFELAPVNETDLHALGTEIALYGGVDAGPSLAAQHPPHTCTRKLHVFSDCNADSLLDTLKQAP